MKTAFEKTKTVIVVLGIAAAACKCTVEPPLDARKYARCFLIEGNKSERYT